MATINQFKANLVGAGPRNNRFEVFIPRSGSKIQFLCKTAALPGQIIEPMEIKYKGLTVKLAGDRTFENWTVGIYNDTDFSVRNGIEEWMQSIVPLDSSVGPVGYEFFNMWPTNLGAIELDTEGGDAVETFDVEFCYSHFERIL